MAQQPAGRRPRLAWALLGLTVVLLAASVLIGLIRGETWNAKFAFIPVSLAFAVVGRARRRANREPSGMAVPGCGDGERRHRAGGRLRRPGPVP